MSATFSNNRLRMGVLVGALVLAFAAQYLYTGELLTHWKDSNTWMWEPRYTLASIFLLLAIGGAAWALASPVTQFAPNLQTESGPNLRPNRTLHWLALAVGCYAFSVFLYGAVGEDRLVQLLWLAAIVCLIIPFLKWPANQIVEDLMPWWQWVAVLALTALGFILRYWHLTEIPSHVDNDVSLMGTFASKLIDTSNFNWLGSSGSGHLLSYDQFLAWSMRLFGENHYGLVMHSVIFGTLTLPLVFLLGRQLFNWRVGLVAMALLTCDYTHIQFSRILFGATSTFFVTLTIYFVFRGLKTNQLRWFAWAGLAAGFGALLYDSGRILPVLVLAIAAWQTLCQRTNFLSNLRNWFVCGLGILIGFGPMLGFALQDFADFNGRGNVVTIFSPQIFQHEAENYQVTTLPQVIPEQAKHAFLTFYLYGDSSPHFAFPRPMVAPLEAVLLTVGLGYCLWRFRDLRSFTLLAWIVLTFILGGVLTYDPPYWPHLNIVLPAVAILAALAADAALTFLAPPAQLLSAVSLRLLGVGLLVYTGYSNWQTYTAYVANNAGPYVRVARYIDQLSPDYQVYLVSDPVNWTDFSFQFINRGVTGYDVTADQLLAAPPPADKPLLFIFMDHQESLETLQKAYPDSVKDDVYASEDSEDAVFESLAVTPPNYVFRPRPAPVNPATLPGWWLIAALLASFAAIPIVRQFRPRPVLVTPDP